MSTAPPEAAARFVDGLSLFGIGASWGGFESLATVVNVGKARSCENWSETGPIVRLHVGLEDPRDLIGDLARGLDALGMNGR